MRNNSAESSIAISPVKIASRINCVPLRLSDASSRAAKSAARVRLSETEVAPPNSLVSNFSAVSKLSGCAPVATRARRRNGATAALLASASTSPAAGIPTWAKARRILDATWPCDRTMTAISE